MILFEKSLERRRKLVIIFRRWFMVMGGMVGFVEVDEEKEGRGREVYLESG